MYLSSQEAIEWVLENAEFSTYYGIAKRLSGDGLTVQPIQISSFHKGKRAMSVKVAERFREVFDIVVSNAHKSKGRPRVY